MIVARNLLKVAASMDGMAREFVIWSVAFSDRSVGSTMLGLALKGAT